MTQLQTFKYTSLPVQCLCTDGDSWFRGKDVATILGYANTKQAIIKNVEDDDKKKMEELGVYLRDPWMQTQKTQSSLTNQVSIP